MDPELQSLSLTRVDQVPLRTPVWVAAQTDIVSVAREFQQRRIAHVLVQGAGPEQAPGIFTTTGLQRAILDGRALSQLPVGELASRPLVTIPPAAPLVEALTAMIRHRIQRLVVCDPCDGRLLGVLEQVDLLSVLSNHSSLLTRQMLDARELADLLPAARQITRVIARMHGGGGRVGQIAHLAQALNGLLFQRCWQLLAPPGLVAASCLFVMGSEGRGEQLLKTDQDNGLLLRPGHGLAPAELAALTQRFSQALADFGYPPCPGRIMLSNPDWCQEAPAFAGRVRQWLQAPSAEQLMALAILLDGHAVAGDAGLLQALRQQVIDGVAGNQVLLSRFAAPALAFDSSAASGPAWWQRLWSASGAAPARDALVDLKKAGSFPLVHGVRSLALAHGVTATGTVARIEALVSAGALDAELGTDLADALQVFMELKLRLGLQALAPELQPGLNDHGPLARAGLHHLDQDLLNDALAVVRRFKALLKQRFHLDQL